MKPNKIDLTGYKVKADGTIISYKKYAEGRALKPYAVAGGYLQVKIVQNKIARSFSLHRIVMQVHGNHTPIKGYEISHLNHIKTDNRLENLEVLTIREHRAKDFTNISTGITGVYPSGKGFQAQIYYKGVTVHLGSDKCKYVCEEYYEGVAATLLEIE